MSEQTKAQPQEEAKAPRFEISPRDRALMNNKLYQLWRFIVLNIKILKAVDHSKRS